MEIDHDLIQKAEKLYNLEAAAWDKGDVLGIVSLQQDQIENEERFFSLTNNDNSIIKDTKPSVFSRTATMAGRALKKAALPVAVGVSILTGSYANLIDDNQYLTDNPIIMDTVQTVPDAGYSIDTPITDGLSIVFEENGKIATVDTSNGSITRTPSQINGLDDARIDNGSTSFKMINGQTYLMLAKDSNGFLRTVESDASGAVPTWYNVTQASDGENLLRAGNNGGVVRENIASGNETTIYSNGSVSNLKIDGDLNLFVANETATNGTLERLLLVDSNDLANATVIHNGAVKFAEMSNGSIHVGVENQQNSQTVDLYTFDQNGTQVGSPIVGLTPNTFDVDDGKMVKIENNGTVYAVDVATGNQTELTNTSVSKTDLDIEGSIATWVQNGTQVAYVTIPDVITQNTTNQSSGPTLEDLMNQLNATNDQLNQTRDQLNASQANETNYLSNISNLTAEIASLQGNATNNSAEISRLNGEVSNLTAEVGIYQANETNNSAEISRLNGEISNRTAEILGLEANEVTYVADISRLNGDVSNLTAEISDYLTQLGTMTDQRDENATLAGSLEDQLNATTDQLNQTQDQLNGTINQRDENATLAGSLSGQVSDLESDKANAISYGNDMTDQRDKNATRAEELQAKIDEDSDVAVALVSGTIGAMSVGILHSRRKSREDESEVIEEEPTLPYMFSSEELGRLNKEGLQGILGDHGADFDESDSRELLIAQVSDIYEMRTEEDNKKKEAELSEEE